MHLSHITTKIYELRGQKVLLDFDLAALYEVQTKYLKRAVKANIKRFTPDFLFELSAVEWETLRCKNCTSNSRGGIRYMPFAFTEQGVAMVSGIVHSDKAIEVNIAIMRAFVFIRQYALSHQDLTEQLKELEAKYDQQFNDVFEAIHFLLEKDKTSMDRPIIGFQTKKPQQ